MKKLYSLVMVTLLTVLCYATADAAPTKSRFKMPENVTLTEKGKEVLKQLASESSLLAESNSSNRKQVRKRVLDENGNGTTIQFFQYEYVWRDLLSFNGAQLSFEEFPYYIVLAKFGEARDNYWYNANYLPLFWPAKSELYGNSDYSCPSLDEMLDYIEEGGIGLFASYNTPVSETGEDYWPFWGEVGALGFTPIVKGESIDIYNPYLPNTYLRLIGHGQEEDAVRLSWNIEYNKDAFQDCGVTLDETVFSETLNETPNYVFEPVSYNPGNNPDNPDDDDTNYSELYLIGSPQDWDIFNGKFRLERVGEGRQYEGTFLFPAGESEFRFYGRLGDWNRYSIGSCNYDEGWQEAKVYFQLNRAETFPVYEYNGGLLGKSNWVLCDFKGGLVKIMINLDTQEITLSPEEFDFDASEFELTLRGFDDDFVYQNENKYFEIVVPEKYIHPGFDLLGSVNEYGSYPLYIYGNWRNEGDGGDACRVYKAVLTVPSYAEGRITLCFSSNFAILTGKRIEIYKEVLPDIFAEYDIDRIEMVVNHYNGITDDYEIVPVELTEDGLYKWKYEFRQSDFYYHIRFYWYDSNGFKRELTSVGSFNGENPNYSCRLTGRFVQADNIYSFGHSAENEDAVRFYTIDPTTGILRVKDPNYEPVLRADTEVYTFLPNRNYEIVIESSDSRVDYEMINSTIDGWAQLWHNWEEYNSETKLNNVHYEFYSEGEGECDLRFNTENGLELIVHVIVKDVMPEEIWVAEEHVQLHVGEFAKVQFGTTPESATYLIIEPIDEQVCEYKHDWGSHYVLIMGNREGMCTYRVIPENQDRYPNLYKDIVVEVLPKDAVIAEHVAYSYMKLGETRGHYLSSHSDGTEASAVWSSSDPTVAEVDAQGRVIAKGNGRALITADCGGHTTVFGVHVDDAVAVGEVDASRVSVYSQGRSIVVAGAPVGETVRVFTSDGVTAASRIANGTALRFEMDAPGVYLLTVGNESFKVATK